MTFTGSFVVLLIAFLFLHSLYCVTTLGEIGKWVCCRPEILRPHGARGRPEDFLRLWLKLRPTSDYRISRHFPNPAYQDPSTRKAIEMGLTLDQKGHMEPVQKAGKALGLPTQLMARGRTGRTGQRRKGSGVSQEWQGAWSQTEAHQH